MIAAAALAGATLAAQPLDARLVRWPTVFKNTVVFTYAGDLWTSDISGGVARRLTSFPGLESRARFSPDGKTIAFSGQVDGGATSVYTIPAEGGEPTRLTFEPSSVIGWAPSGRLGFASSSQNIFTGRLFFVRPTGGQPVGTDLREITDGSFSPDGGTIAFTRSQSHNFNWRRYRGGTQGKISFFEFATGKYWQVPAGRDQSYHPMWVGDSVFFISDRQKGTQNLYRYDTKSRRVEQMTTFGDADIRWPSTDGENIIWERSGKVELYNISSKSLREFSANILSDGRSVRPRYRSLAGSVGSFSLSPSGKRLAVEARGDIYSVPATTGDTRALTTGQRSRESSPAWSPDGNNVAYLSDESGEWKITIQPQRGGAARTLKTPDAHRIRSFSWSPTGKFISYLTFDWRIAFIPSDGTGEAKEVMQDRFASFLGMDFSPDEKWIAFGRTTPNLFSRIDLYNVETGKTTQVTTGFYADRSPVFDQTGKYLYFISSRSLGVNFDDFQGGTLHQTDTERVYILPLNRDENVLDAPEDEEPGRPVAAPAAAPPAGAPGAGGPPAAPAPAPAPAVNFDGIANRARPLPWPPGSYGLLVGARNGVFTWTQGNLLFFSLQARQSLPILQGVSAVSFTPDRSKLAYRTGQTVGIIDARPGAQPGQGAVNFGSVATMWNPRDEYQQMFWEVWRWQRDVFYDAGMMGLDWKAVGDRYASMLPSVGDRSDLNYVFGQLIGELGTGHAYVQGGETEVSPGPGIGLLGADFEVVGSNVRFEKIYPGFPDLPGASGPLHEKNVKAGDFLLAINGKPVSASTSISQMLLDTAGKDVTLTVNATPSTVGAREIEVSPIASDQQLRYHTWIAERRALVDQWSGGRIGYLHVPDTSAQGIIEFIRGFYSTSDKEAWVIDERFNGGGFIPTFFLDHLTRVVDSAFKGRYGEPFKLPSQTLEGPKAMLINQYAGSGGDMLPWLFRNRKVGPLVGMRTWGGLVGIQGGVPLVDGGNVTAPGFGIFDPERGEWIAENKGVDPDMEVDNNPGVIARGEDAQLRKAVDWLMDELKSGKGRKPIRVPASPRLNPNP